MIFERNYDYNRNSKQGFRRTRFKKFGEPIHQEKCTGPCTGFYQNIKVP